MGQQVQEEKQQIYKSCYESLAQKHPMIRDRECEVIGLWMGARGTVSTEMVNFFDKFKLDKKELPKMAEKVLIDSVRMIHYHIYA